MGYGHETFLLVAVLTTVNRAVRQFQKKGNTVAKLVRSPTVIESNYRGG
jgi:hypothetical protein